MKTSSIKGILIILLGLVAAAAVAYGVADAPKSLIEEDDVPPVWLIAISGFLVLPIPYLFTRFRLMQIPFVRRFAPLFAIFAILAFVMAVILIITPIVDDRVITPINVLGGIIAPVLVVTAAFHTRRLAARQ